MPIKMTEELVPGEKPGKSKFAPGKDAIKAQQEKDRAAIEKVQANGAPPIPFEPRCHVCTSPHRQYIETLLVKGDVPYIWIQENVPGNDGSKIDRRSVSTHAKKHMGHSNAAIRAILEEEASIAGQNFEEGVRGAITHRGVLELALRRSYQDIIDGVTTVEPRDMIAIINAIQKMDEQAEQVAVNLLRAQVQALIESVKAESGPELWSRIYDRFKVMMADDGYALESGVDATVAR